MINISINTQKRTSRTTKATIIHFIGLKTTSRKKKHKHILCGNKAKSEKGTNEPAKQRTKSTKINKFETE